MNNALRQRFIQLISERTGLCIRAQEQEALEQKIQTRMKCLKLSSPEEYFQLLSDQTEESDREWKTLIVLLTTCETYFFRDAGQFRLLQNQILPQLIDIKRKESSITGENPTLRFWSAGCSTGEEAYSLAIILRELLPDYNEWNILILGTDINQEVIERAKRGIYNSWSFRTLKQPLQNQYFHQRKNEWELDKKICKMVTFCHLNLVQDDFSKPHSNIRNMDLILCRNVFVYFGFKSIAVVLEKFYNALRPGGYLLTGHTELYGQDLSRFQIKVLPESVVYQRSEDLQRLTSPVASSIPTQQTLQFNSVQPEQAIATSHIAAIAPTLPTFSTLHPTKSTTRTTTRTLPDSHSAKTSVKAQESFQEPGVTASFQEAEILFGTKAYLAAIKKAKQALDSESHLFEAYYLIAQSYANLGEHQQAVFYCHQALAVDSSSILPYYLLAQIYQEKGNIEEAKAFLKKIIYLVPSSIFAYLELGSLYQKTGDKTRSRKMFSTAFDLLKMLPPSTTVEHQREVKAGELLAYVQKLLRD